MALRGDDEVPASLQKHTTYPTMERSGVITRLGEVVALSKQKHVELLQPTSDPHGSSPVPRKVITELAKQHDNVTEDAFLRYVHTHPTGGPPSDTDIANSTRNTNKHADVVVGDDIYLIYPTEETSELNAALGGEASLAPHTREAYRVGQEEEGLSIYDDDYFNRTLENGVKRAADVSRQVVYKYSYERQVFERQVPSKSLVD